MSHVVPIMVVTTSLLLCAALVWHGLEARKLRAAVKRNAEALEAYVASFKRP